MASQNTHLRRYPLPPKLAKALELDSPTDVVSRSVSTPSIGPNAATSPRAQGSPLAATSYQDIRDEVVSQVSQFLKGKVEEGVDKVFDTHLRNQISALAQQTAQKLLQVASSQAAQHSKTHTEPTENQAKDQKPAKITTGSGGMWRKLDEAHEEIKLKDKKLAEARQKIRSLSAELESMRKGGSYTAKSPPWWSHSAPVSHHNTTPAHEEDAYDEREQPHLNRTEQELISVKQQLLQTKKITEEYKKKLQQAVQENASLKQQLASIKKEASKASPSHYGPQSPKHEARRAQDEISSLKQQLMISRKEIERFHSLLLERRKNDGSNVTKTHGNQEAILAYEKLFNESSGGVAKHLMSATGMEKLDARKQPALIFEASYEYCKMAAMNQIYYKILDTFFQPQSSKTSQEALWVIAGAYEELANFAGIRREEVARKEKEQVLKQVHEMLKSQLKHSTATQSNVIHAFVKQAVDIAWNMVTASPPMVLDTGPEFSESLHEPQHPFCNPTLLSAGKFELVYLRPTLMHNFSGEPAQKGWVAARQVDHTKHSTRI